MASIFLKLTDVSVVIICGILACHLSKEETAAIFLFPVGVLAGFHVVRLSDRAYRVLDDKARKLKSPSSM